MPVNIKPDTLTHPDYCDLHGEQPQRRLRGMHV
jgi:hypothetical protein